MVDIVVLTGQSNAEQMSLAFPDPIEYPIIDPLTGAYQNIVNGSAFGAVTNGVTILNLSVIQLACMQASTDLGYGLYGVVSPDPSTTVGQYGLPWAANTSLLPDTTTPIPSWFNVDSSGQLTASGSGLETSLTSYVGQYYSALVSGYNPPYRSVDHIAVLNVQNESDEKRVFPSGNVASIGQFQGLYGSAIRQRASDIASAFGKSSSDYRLSTVYVPSNYTAADKLGRPSSGGLEVAYPSIQQGITAVQTEDQFLNDIGAAKLAPNVGDAAMNGNGAFGTVDANGQPIPYGAGEHFSVSDLLVAPQPYEATAVTRFTHTIDNLLAGVAAPNSYVWNAVQQYGGVDTGPVATFAQAVGASGNTTYQVVVSFQMYGGPRDFCHSAPSAGSRAITGRPTPAGQTVGPAGPSIRPTAR